MRSFGLVPGTSVWGKLVVQFGVGEPELEEYAWNSQTDVGTRGLV